MIRTYRKLGRKQRMVFKPVESPGFEKDLKLAQKILNAEKKLQDINEYMSGLKRKQKIPFEELPEIFEKKVQFLKSLVKLISLRIKEKETYYSPSEKNLTGLGELYGKYSQDLINARNELAYVKKEVSEWVRKKKKK